MDPEDPDSDLGHFQNHILFEGTDISRADLAKVFYFEGRFDWYRFGNAQVTLWRCLVANMRDHAIRPCW